MKAAERKGRGGLWEMESEFHKEFWVVAKERSCFSALLKVFSGSCLIMHFSAKLFQRETAAAFPTWL